MDYTKVPQQINDTVGDNIAKLAQLFPSAVKDGEVDFEALKEELGQFTEVGSEKYELTWAGKADAKRIAREDIVGKTLKYIPEDSKDADTTENLYIEGDNLEVLKLLRQNYYGAIKMIYIDPPYNTGNDFVYNDSFEMSKEESDIAEGNVDLLGERYAVNKDSQNRYHAKWLDMMYPRLKIARELLTDDGIIFISIDDNELDNLKKICDEIFGTNNFLANICWKRKKEISNDSKNIAIQGEYILCYSKSEKAILSLEPLSDEYINKAYNEPTSEFPLGKWRPVPLTVSKGLSGGGYTYPIKTPSGKQHERLWAYPEQSYQKLVEAGRVYFGKNNDGIPQRVMYAFESKGQPITNYWDNTATNKEGKKEILDLFESSAFDTAKPPELIKRMINVSTDTTSIICDFFSGSATTAHAVMKINATENASRKFIMVQLPEKCSNNSEPYKLGYSNICEIGKERIRRAGEKIKSEYPDADIDIGFKVFRVADTNIKWNSLMDLGQLDVTQLESTPDQMDFMPDAKDIDVVYELMLRQRDVALSESIELLSDIGNRTYLYASSFLVCLETEITESLVEKIAAIDPLPIKFIFRDSAFKDDIALKDETFRRLKALVEKNSGESKPTYTVEFI